MSKEPGFPSLWDWQTVVENNIPISDQDINDMYVYFKKRKIRLSTKRHCRSPIKRKRLPGTRL